MLPKYPRTLHLESSKGIIDPDSIPFSHVKDKYLVVEEKMDGSTISIHFDDQAELQVLHRNQIARGPEFDRLKTWLAVVQNDLFDVLSNRFVLYGEWLAHAHTVYYNRLPDYFLEYDLYDQEAQIWLSTSARSKVLSGLPIHSVSVLSQGTFADSVQLTKLLGSSNFTTVGSAQKPSENFLDTSGFMEGLYIKEENECQVLNRYKFIRPEFMKILLSSIHWQKRNPIRNQLL